MSLKLTGDNNYDVSIGDTKCYNQHGVICPVKNTPSVNPSFKANQNDSFESSQSHTGRNLAVGAAFFAIIGGGVAFLVSRGRNSKAVKNGAKQISENIEFIPAKTIEEAKTFGKTHLGIETYKDIDNLEILNWVHGGIVKVSNKMKGKLNIPKTVELKELESDVPAAVSFVKDVAVDKLVINKSIFNVYDKYIENFLNDSLEKGVIKTKDGKYFLNNSLKNEQFSDEFNDLLTRFKTNTSPLMLIEKSILSNTIDNIYNIFEQFDNVPIEKIKQLINEKNIIWKEKKLGIEDIQKLDIEEQRTILTSLLTQKKAIGSMIEYKKGEPYKHIEHELAHILHRSSAGNDIYKMYKEEEIKDFRETDYSIIKDFLNDSQKQQTVRKVSSYSATSPAEFVAETFTKMVNDEKLSDDVIKLYRYYKGPEIPS